MTKNKENIACNIRRIKFKFGLNFVFIQYFLSIDLINKIQNQRECCLYSCIRLTLINLCLHHHSLGMSCLCLCLCYLGVAHRTAMCLGR